MGQKPLKTELHHWWPRTLQNHWSAADGMVSVVRSSGDVDRAPPGRYGAITNAHHEKLGGPWDSTFEPLFNQPDGEIADFVSWMTTLQTSLVPSDRPMVERIEPQPFPSRRQAQIARITASLLARSPDVRNLIKLGVEDVRGRFGFEDPTADKSLIAANQRGLYDAYRKLMEGSGRWAILLSGDKDFVAGDGFLHNFPASRDGLHSGLKLVLPFLPTTTIVYMLPREYPTEPRLVTLRVGAAEVAMLNDIVQVYAKEFLFFRDDKPILSEAFTRGVHQQLQYHGHDRLDVLLDDLSQYNLWGPGGTASMADRRPYTEALKGNRWLAGFTRREK